MLFFGTAEFAVPILKKLLDNEDYKIVGLVTQPDRPMGRKRELAAAPVKAWLTTNAKEVIEKGELEIFQPESIRKEAVSILEKSQPELIIVVAYGQIIPAEMINYPKHGCLNVHGSLLPEYRGAIPIEKALLDGRTETGVSILKMTPGLDDGPVLAESSIKIRAEDDSIILRRDLAQMGADLLLDVLPDWIAGGLEPISQEELARRTGRKLSFCYAPELSREKAKIEPTDNFKVSFNKIRAFANSGKAWLEIEYKGMQRELKISKARFHEPNPTQKNMGKLFSRSGSLVLNLAGGNLELLEVQLAGSKPGRGRDYLYLVEDTSDNTRIVAKADNYIVLIRRRKMKGKEYFVLPGGHRLRTETIEQAAIRELQEETGITVSEEDLQFINKFNDKNYQERIYYYLVNLENLPQNLQMSGPEAAHNNVNNEFEIVLVDARNESLDKSVKNGLKVYNFNKIKKRILGVNILAKVIDLPRASLQNS